MQPLPDVPADEVPLPGLRRPGPAGRAVLDGLVTDVDAGTSRALVLRGAAGAGKTALLDHLVARTAGWRVVTAAGVASETDLPYCGLHQVCAPLLDRLDALPAPQREALGVVFGLHPGPPPDRFLVGLAALGLLAAAAAPRPVAWVIDDAQWLDPASAQVLAFVARRLRDRRAAVVCATRAVADDALTGLPELCLPEPPAVRRARVELVRTVPERDGSPSGPDRAGLRSTGRAAAVAGWDDAAGEGLGRRYRDLARDAGAPDDLADACAPQWARAVLANGLGRYAAALAAARDAADPEMPGPPQWALAELVEAGVRSGDTAAAAAALDRLAAVARAAGTDWALGVAASRRALLETGAAAEALHREAVERLGRTRVRVELARAQLLYGEWLRRQGRRVDSRAHLRAAHDALTAVGADAFAARARRELLATGETLRRHAPGEVEELTAQEAHIARLAGDGLTNTEIGATLYLSPRTVEWHLGKIFTKLGVRSRRQLRAPGPVSIPG